MTKLEAWKEVALRDGHTPEYVKNMFEKVVLDGALPPDAYEQIPGGSEESFIQKHLGIKRKADFLRQTSPSYNDAMKAVEAKRLPNN